MNIVTLCSLALCLWGYQTGLWFFAAPMMLGLEGRHFVRRRWQISWTDLKQMFKLCGVLFGLSLTFLLFTQRSFTLIYSLLQWLPIFVFPLMLAQTYCLEFSLLLRLFFSNPDLVRKGFSWKQKPIHLYDPYFALCLISASATNRHGLVFYGATAILIAIWLWTIRPQRTTPILWVCLFLLASGMGFVGHLQLHQLQAKLEQQTAPWLSGLSVDPYQSMTQMGSIGTLKQSNAIVFRVAVGDDSESVEDHRLAFPLLLREATYNKYGFGAWVAIKSKFKPVRPSADGNNWTLGQTVANSASIRVSTNLNGGKGVLRLPNGTSEIKQLPVDQMQKNQYGAVKVSGKPGAIAYQVQFDPQQWPLEKPVSKTQTGQGRSMDSPPTDNDLQIPDAEKPAIEQTLQALEIDGKSDSEVVNRVALFFNQDFQYSLDLSNSNQSSTPLSSFLLNNRSGHCEYFASATTLLLRGAGIPARYAVGYSVHEFSPLEQQYIVRSRNAHAWTMAYFNGSWQSVDTTPPDWTAQEDAMASPLQAISDLWSFLIFKLFSGFNQIAKIGLIGYIGLAIAPFACFLLWKWGRKIRIGRSTGAANSRSALNIQPRREGIDSEFYLIEQRLNDLDLKRHASESLQRWILRLKTQLPESQFEALRRILKLHYRYRFDPQGIEPMDRERLRSLSQSWLDEFCQRHGAQYKD